MLRDEWLSHVRARTIVEMIAWRRHATLVLVPTAGAREQLARTLADALGATPYAQLVTRDECYDWLHARVPQALVDRPKMGFGVPLADWFRGPLRARMDAYCASDAFDDIRKMSRDISHALPAALGYTDA